MAPKNIYQRMKKLNQRMAVNLRRGIGPTQVVLLLTTTGRKSGLARVTPLQFEQVGEDIYIASALGKKADWYRNIQAKPQVQVMLRKKEFSALAEPVADPQRMADFLELRLQRHPIMIRLIMHLFDGLPLRFDRDNLVKLSEGKAMVILHPEEEG
jgi:deazaflavin-dependent oxidoreductase (nitroreductase family)